MEKSESRRSRSSTRNRPSSRSLTNLHARIRPKLRIISGSLARLAALACHPAFHFDIILTDDRRITELASQYRHSPHATDVLAFRYAGGDGEEPFGEIVISLDTAARQARERGLSIEIELMLLIVHGILHISGLGDESARDWQRMRIAEFETMMRIL